MRPPVTPTPFPPPAHPSPTRQDEGLGSGDKPDWVTVAAVLDFIKASGGKEGCEGAGSDLTGTQLCCPCGRARPPDGRKCA
jgi:hypothetical protein